MRNFHFHCWHIVEGSRRKIKRKYYHCKELSPFYQLGGHILYAYKKKCCICGKIKECIGKDYDVSRAMKYLSRKEI